MRRRKSIFPALIIEALAVAGLAAVYFFINPFATEQVDQSNLPSVEYLAEDAHEIPRYTSPTQPAAWQEPVVYQPPATSLGEPRPHVSARPTGPPQRFTYSAARDTLPRNIIGVN